MEDSTSMWSLTAGPLPWLLVAGTFLLILRALRRTYRLHFHPLSKFRGPPAAALSTAWVHRLSKAGKQEEEFERLHEQYGTSALRVGPNELHINDVSLYKKIYSQSRPYLKDEFFYAGFSVDHSTFAEIDPALHKERRRMLNPFFSRAGLQNFEDQMKEHIYNLRSKIKTLSQRDIPIVGNNAFRCVTMDIIGEFAFAQKGSAVKNSDDTFYTPHLDVIDAVDSIVWDSIYKPVERQIRQLLPTSLAKLFHKEVGIVAAFIDAGAKSYQAYQSSVKGNEGTTTSPVIFDGLAGLPPDTVVTEAMELLLAGSDTTAFTLYTAVRHIAANSQSKQSLTAALKEAYPTKPATVPDSRELEKIPYLMACVKESLRVAMAIEGRLPRVVPSEGEPLIVDGDTVVPPGTIVGMGAYTMHFSKQLWGPDAKEFRPERWLDEEQNDDGTRRWAFAETAKKLEPSLVPFSKGPRNCVGQNLALMELVSVLYMLFREFDIAVEGKTGKEQHVRMQDTKDVFSKCVVGSDGFKFRMKWVDV